MLQVKTRNTPSATPYMKGLRSDSSPNQSSISYSYKTLSPSQADYLCLKQISFSSLFKKKTHLFWHFFPNTPPPPTRVYILCRGVPITCQNSTPWLHVLYIRYHSLIVNSLSIFNLGSTSRAFGRTLEYMRAHRHKKSHHYPLRGFSITIPCYLRVACAVGPVPRLWVARFAPCIGFYWGFSILFLFLLQISETTFLCSPALEIFKLSWQTILRVVQNSPNEKVYTFDVLF